jgi:hypothetical protein
MPFPAAAGAAIYVLAGVPLNVTGPSAILPMQPDPAHMEVVLPTTSIDAGSSILMSDGSRWTVRSKRGLSSGAVQVALKPPSSSTLTTLTVPPVSVTTPIWWVGEIEEPPEDPPPTDVPVEDPTPPTAPESP